MSMTVETKITFANELGNKLTGLLVRPASWEGGSGSLQGRTRGKVIVLLHGLYQHKNINMLRPFGKRIAEDEEMGSTYATFRFDCRGLGESEGTTSFTPHHINMADLQAAVSHLEGGSCSAGALSVHCIFGYSAGGNVAVMYASERAAKGMPPIPFITAHSSRFYMDGIQKTLTEQEAARLEADGVFEYTFTKRGKPQVLSVDTATIEAFEQIDMSKYCRGVPAGTAVLLTHGLADDRVPPADTAGYASNIANATQHLIPQAGHDYKEEGASDALYSVFKKWLLNGAAESTEWRRAAFAKL